MGVHTEKTLITQLRPPLLLLRPPPPQCEAVRLFTVWRPDEEEVEGGAGGSERVSPQRRYGGDRGAGAGAATSTKPGAVPPQLVLAVSGTESHWWVALVGGG